MKKNSVFTFRSQSYVVQWLTIAIISELFAGNQGNHQNFVPSLESHKLWLIWIGMKQKKIQNGRFSWKNIENWWSWKSQFFCVGHFEFFCFKSVIIYVIPRMGQNFDDYPDFQQKARGYKIMRNTVAFIFCYLSFL